MKTNVVVVVPNWNGKKLLADCLHSLESQTMATNIIVVDNGSSDGSKELVQQEFPDVELIELSKNHGFAGGVNRGIELSIKNDADYVALFNNDATADKNWLVNLIQVMQTHAKAGVVTGKLLRSDKKHIDSTGEHYSTWGMPFPRGRNQKDEGQYNKPEPVFGASGGASLYRVSMLKEIGLFDKDFFAYFEDVDISFRAQLAGWSVRYTPDAVAYHHIGGTSSKLGSFTRYHSIKNAILLYDKNMPGWLFWKYKPLFLLQVGRMLLGSLRDKQFGVFIKALAKSLLLAASTISKRRRIQKSRTVSVKYVDQLLHHGRPPKVEKL